MSDVLSAIKPIDWTWAKWWAVVLPAIGIGLQAWQLCVSPKLRAGGGYVTLAMLVAALREAVCVPKLRRDRHNYAQAGEALRGVPSEG